MLRRTLLLSALVAAAPFFGFVVPTWTAPVPLKKPQPKEITNSIGMKLVLIPATPPGKGFLMGSTKQEQDDAIADYEKIVGKKASATVLGYFRGEGPRHEVEITKPFYMGAYTVTQKEFKAVMSYNPSYFSQDGAGKTGVTYTDKPAGGKDKVPADTSKFPVDNVNWEEAKEFCAKLSAREKEKAAGRVYRLPTEAEWEYACRAGTKTAFHYGDSLSSTQANFDGEYPYGGADKGPCLKRTCKVDSYKPNAFGLYSMHGNVYQWCSDWYGKDYCQNSDKKDPKGTEDGKCRVLRGGSWLGEARHCRAADRTLITPGIRYGNFGFRVACGVARTR